MNSKSIKKEIQGGLKNGKSKSELYEEYSQSVDDDRLRRILASKPAHDVETKFKILHKIICWVWTLFFVLEFIGSIDLIFNIEIKPLISLFISAYLLRELWRFNGDVYLPAIFWSVWGIFNGIKEINRQGVDEDMIFFSYSYILVLLITIGVMLIVRYNVFGYYSWFRPALDKDNKIIFQKE